MIFVITIQVPQRYPNRCLLILSLANASMISPSITPDAPAKVNLARFDGGRFAVVVHQLGQRQIIRGIAHYEQDADLGAILRIRPSDDANHAADLPEFILQEGIWEERILPDRHCD
jgi:hypothetical protein